MKELLAKLSSYNIFNYLFPGVVFAIILSKISDINLVQKDILTGAFLYYFIGLIVSRIGSLFIEPFLKWINFIKFADYSKFVSASKVDAKIELFSEVNNMYRTLCSLFLLLVVFKAYDTYLSELSFFKDYGSVLVIVLLLILFVCSYRKQTNYITKRVDSNQPTP